MSHPYLVIRDFTFQWSMQLLNSRTQIRIFGLGARQWGSPEPENKTFLDQGDIHYQYGFVFAHTPRTQNSFVLWYGRGIKACPTSENIFTKQCSEHCFVLEFEPAQTPKKCSEQCSQHFCP